jgi:pentatricopeptide repeat protein
MTNRWRIQPNSYTLSILIKRFGRQGDLSKAFQLVDQLPRRFGFRANAHVWTCLISACVAHGRLQTAECVFESMRGSQSRVRTLLQSNAEIETPAEFKQLSNALAMAAMCPPDAKTYETLAQGFLRFNDVKKAVETIVDGLSKFRGKLSQQCVTQVAQVAVQYGMDISALVRSCV